MTKLLIANRGEIALRIIRTCRTMGIPTVAIYSQADANALHARFADEAVCIGPPNALKSYLHQPAVLAAAEITGADLIHPGYGFLAENAEFAAAVRGMGLTFVGPATEHLRLFGDKLSAKAAARRANVPLLGGSEGATTSVDEALEVANTVGFPVIVKAAAGGGGKGMRVVRDADELRRVYDLASAEALASFGNGDVFVERFLDKPRHIEVQVAGDGVDGVHIGTRDCSLQRRHQKIVEEAPAVGLDPKVEADLLEAAARLVREVGYVTVATVEFLVQDGKFYFLEVNPRIQVEHPVTEETTGIDLIEHQIRLAMGEPLALDQAKLRPRGHAIEVRVNAEDPWTFLPSPGTITGYHEPGGPGVRIDSAVHEHATIPPYYDSLAAKLIVRGADRNEALRRMDAALEEFIIEGIKTTMPMQRELLRTPEFREVRMWTSFVDQWLAERTAS